MKKITTLTSITILLVLCGYGSTGLTPFPIDGRRTPDPLTVDISALTRPEEHSSNEGNYTTTTAPTTTTTASTEERNSFSFLEWVRINPTNYLVMNIAEDPSNPGILLVEEVVSGVYRLDLESVLGEVNSDSLNATDYAWLGRLYGIIESFFNNSQQAHILSDKLKEALRIFCKKILILIVRHNQYSSWFNPDNISGSNTTTYNNIVGLFNLLKLCGLSLKEDSLDEDIIQWLEKKLNTYVNYVATIVPSRNENGEFDRQLPFDLEYFTNLHERLLSLSRQGTMPHEALKNLIDNLINYIYAYGFYNLSSNNENNENSIRIPNGTIAHNFLHALSQAQLFLGADRAEYAQTEFGYISSYVTVSVANNGILTVEFSDNRGVKYRITFGQLVEFLQTNSTIEFNEIFKKLLVTIMHQFAINRGLNITHERESNLIQNYWNNIETYYFEANLDFLDINEGSPVYVPMNYNNFLLMVERYRLSIDWSEYIGILDSIKFLLNKITENPSTVAPNRRATWNAIEYILNQIENYPFCDENTRGRIDDTIKDINSLLEEMESRDNPFYNYPKKSVFE